MLVDEGYFGQAIVNLKLCALLVDSSGPVRYLHRLPERLGDSRVLSDDGKREVLCLDSAEGELVVSRQVIKPVLRDFVFVECLKSIGVVALGACLWWLAGDVTRVTVDATDAREASYGREAS